MLGGAALFGLCGVVVIALSGGGVCQLVMGGLFGGDRFRDAVHAREVEEVAAPAFDQVAGGYDASWVDRLAQEARDALADGPFQQRFLVKLKIEHEERPTAAYGYDREQVDRYLGRLSELLFTL